MGKKGGAGKGSEDEEEERRCVFTSLREARRSRPVDSTRAVSAAAFEA